MQQDFLEDSIEDLLEDENDADVPLHIDGPRRLVTEPRDLTLRELHLQEQEGELVLQPEFQRFYVFDDTKASRLIESVLMNVPLPLVYLAEENDAKLSVIDGQQRLKSFFRFLGNEFKLHRLTILDEHNGKCFRDLPDDVRRHIRSSTLRCIVIKRESDPDVKFEIFERLNTGSVTLNDQELRNCIYRGSFNDLLRELSNHPDWLRLLGRREPDKRMVDREIILRFFSLYLDTNQYQPPMRRFLNGTIGARQHATPEEIQKWRDLFYKTVAMVFSVFGDRAFKRYEPGDSTRPDGSWGRGTRLNMALFDVVMTSFACHEKRDIMPQADAVREALIDLMATNRVFIDAITKGTSERQTMFTRRDIWNNRLREVLDNPRAEPRLFSRQFREQLFEQNPECALCKQRIMSVDDAAVDHTVPYSLGGATDEPNGRLAHRYCNSARGNHN